jgi:hypothetical protein
MKTSRFKINAVDVCAPFRLRITFGDGVVMNVDLAGVIHRFPALSLLKDESLFSRAHVGEWGLTVDWISGEIDLAGDNLRAEAIEQSGGISHERIWNWMDRNNLTLDGAADALGISRRMVAYYRNGEKAIPKHIWLACLGWERCTSESPEAWKDAA